MTSAAPTLAFDADPHRTYDDTELNAFLWRRFFGMPDDEVIELVVLPPSPKAPPHVAYASDAHAAVRLMREGAAIYRGTGVYVVPNKIKPGIAARYPLNRWAKADAGRCGDHEIERARTIYIDCDAERVKGISATDAEKAAAYDLSRRVQDFLVDRLGDDHALARGDSGNGYSLFIALEPFTPTKETGEKIEQFLKAIAAKFAVPGAKVDTSVFNPARLVPCFGTVKTKGASTGERPHRTTHFICRPHIRRLPLEAIA